MMVNSRNAMQLIANRLSFRHAQSLRALFLHRIGVGDPVVVCDNM